VVHVSILQVRGKNYSPIMNRYLHAPQEVWICVIPYARAEAKQFARGDMPSKMDTRNPNSFLW
jgi:hypothetical protein